ncbi:SGNH/GDSL hydrolase family protein [Cyanobium sp. ATX 6A2]|uniref:SGNH/GDSL hydrolase family protein n=1 Tax=Cyanobium sp. ATX 6A2 TaxID=2823700 RepID=UPI0020CE4BBF|nr:SGNH/GDSL hydrolase family protein [Cyanobium sp. ATX 6A2]
MTSAFAFLGDSTLDFGNLTATASFLGERHPFRQPLYNGGGNVKASDGFVLGEQIVRRLGAASRKSPARLSSAELINLSNEPLRRGLRNTDPNAQVFNFAYAGATSGGRGSSTAGLEDFQIGLKRQAATLAEAAQFTRSSPDLDVIISGGTNDVFDFLEGNQTRIRNVLLTPGRGDDNRLANLVARKVVANIDESLDSITGLYNEAVVIGTTKLSAIPRIRQSSNELKRVPLLGSSLANEFRGFADRISGSINARLEEKYNSSDENGIFAVNGIDAWKSLRSPGFVDTIHPDSKTNGRLADFVVSQISDAAVLDSFGL